MLRPIAGPGIHEADDTLLVDDDVGAFGQVSLFIPYPKGLHGLSVPVAQQSMLNLCEVDEGLLGEDGVGTHH